MDLDKAIQSRKSVRRFSSKKPDWRAIIECIDAGRYAPMAGGMYTPRFILVDNESVIQQLTDAAQQDFIAQAQYVVVVCSDPKRTINSYEKRGERYVRQQAGSAIQNFLLKIEEVGLSTCWVGEFVDRLVKAALKLPENIDVEAIFPVGYEHIKSKTKEAKIDIDRVLYFNRYNNRKMKPPKGLNV